ncbi:hypothetical protein D1BOALGB6SA_7683 [Olavius sp. associated proteobacterium Delta 1]|nr:hypothetical protein D1BOALGB6SA_7683 [Olavius sp. associated proteobacterium Delta 1]
MKRETYGCIRHHNIRRNLNTAAKLYYRLKYRYDLIYI